MARLRSDFWVAAYLRRCAIEGIDAVLRRRGAAEAGAVFVKLDHLDGTASLFGPAPPSFDEEARDERRFTLVAGRMAPFEVEERFKRELGFDPDVWLVEVESREGRHLLELGSEA